MKDPLHGDDQDWTSLADAVETAARFRRLFPRDGFDGLTSPELQVLVTVAAWPDLTPGQVAESLAMEKNSVSQPLRRLEELRLIRTSEDLEDRRSKAIHLTSKGSRLVARFERNVMGLD